MASEPLRPLTEGALIKEGNQKTDQYLRNLAYMKLPGVVLKQTRRTQNLPTVEHDKELIKNLPECFDARDKWPNCPSLKEIRDQGRCGSCWALSSVSAMTDRVCTYSNGTKSFHFSAEDLTTCSHQGGCQGGNPYEAWKFWVENGLASGGNYGSHEGCKPYSIPTCLHHMTDCTNYSTTPTCKHACVDGYKVSYEEDLRHGVKVYAVGGEGNYMAELYSNGPFVVSFAVYEDLADYTGGVYQHVHGELLSRHAVKLMGWGVEEGIKYWLITNSWGTDFGAEGYFKILRGTNECGIEEAGTAGVPRLSEF